MASQARTTPALSSGVDSLSAVKEMSILYGASGMPPRYFDYPSWSKPLPRNQMLFARHGFFGAINMIARIILNNNNELKNGNQIIKLNEV